MVQNSVPSHDSVATSAAQFFRTTGGTIGVVMGAIRRLPAVDVVALHSSPTRFTPCSCWGCRDGVALALVLLIPETPLRRRWRRAADAHDHRASNYNVTLAVLALAALSMRCSRRWWRQRSRRSSTSSGATPPTVTWVLTVYLLSASIATPILGRLGDIFGKERMLLIVCSCSVVERRSTSLGLLMAGRACRARPAHFPLAFGIIRDESRASASAPGSA